MKVFIISSILLACSAAIADSATTCKKPTIPAGSTWVSSPGCLPGNTYTQQQPKRAHCHCNSHCGYICDPLAEPTAATPKPTTASSGTKCTGSTPNKPGYHCRCQGYNKVFFWQCDPIATTTTVGPSTTAATTVATTSAGADTTTTGAATTTTGAATDTTTAATTTAATTTAATTTAATTTAATTTAATTTAATTTTTAATG